MKNMKIACASILLSCVSNSWQAYAMKQSTPSNVSEYKVQMSIRQTCPIGKIFDLPGLEYMRSAEILPAYLQGANSTTFKLHDQIIKISKNVEPADELSKELENSQKTYDMLRGLRNPGFDFAIPQKTHKIWSSDHKGMCFVEISKALPTLVNDRYYKYIYKDIDARAVFFDLGKALAQLQNSKPSTLEYDGYYYGIQHGDFQMGNIFYDPNSHTGHTFTLIDLGNVAEHKRLLLDPLYLVYSLSITIDGKRERFIEELKNATTKTKISNMITAFINGYVSNLNPTAAEQINKTIQENMNPTDVFYSGPKYLYKGKDVIDGVRNNRELVEFFNPLIKQAFATAYMKTFGSKMVSTLKPQESTFIQSEQSVSQPFQNIDQSITSLSQLPGMCTADRVSLHLEMYPNLKDLTGLGQCTNLKRLYLQGTSVSDIEEIGKLTNLEELDLSSSQVESLLPLAGYANYTYAGLPIKLHEGLKNLKILTVKGIKKITGYKQLKEKLPDLTIKTSSNTEIE